MTYSKASRPTSANTTSIKCTTNKVKVFVNQLIHEKQVQE